MPIKWWVKGPIDRSSDTDSISWLYWPIQSVYFKFRFLYQPIVSVSLKFQFFNRAIFLRVYTSDFYIYQAIVSVCFKLRLFNRPILFWFQVPTFVSTDCDGQYLGKYHKQKKMSFILSWFLKSCSLKLIYYFDKLLTCVAYIITTGSVYCTSISNNVEKGNPAHN
jgi:hypothetical protein